MIRPMSLPQLLKRASRADTWHMQDSSPHECSPPGHRNKANERVPTESARYKSYLVCCVYASGCPYTGQLIPTTPTGRPYFIIKASCNVAKSLGKFVLWYTVRSASVSMPYAIPDHELGGINHLGLCLAVHTATHRVTTKTTQLKLKP
jgi:hypothetical protein